MLSPPLVRLTLSILLIQELYDDFNVLGLGQILNFSGLLLVCLVDEYAIQRSIFNSLV